MTPRKLNVLFVFYSYSGNSSGTSEGSPIREWFSDLIVVLKTDEYFKERLGNVSWETLADTPITMTRNRSVVMARNSGFDVLVMVDSDMVPDVHQGDYGAQPFFQSSFKFLYDHYDKGPVVVAAPYGGCPPHENMFVFCWSGDMNAGDETPFQLRQYNRDEAMRMSGIQEAAALPTGLIMYDVRAFALIEPSHLSKREVLEQLVTGRMSLDKASCALESGWFRYEWKDQTASEKASTEDVQNTRDISLAGYQVLGYNPVFCNWDAWSGHNKVWTVKKPQKYCIENFSETLQRAVNNRWSLYDRVMQLDGKRFRHLPFSQVNPERNGASGAKHSKPAELPRSIESKLSMRVVCGHICTSFEMMTPIEHLTELHNLVRAESERLARKVNVVEIGSYVGESAVAMASTGCCENIVCVDNFKGVDKEWRALLQREIGGADTLRKLFKQNTCQFDNIHLLEGLSYRVASEVDLSAIFEPLDKADFILIDGDHSFDSTKRDITDWLGKLSEDGVMVGHDFRAERYPGVEDAVLDVFGDLARPFGLLGAKGGFWLVWMSEHANAKAQNGA